MAVDTTVAGVLLVIGLVAVETDNGGLAPLERGVAWVLTAVMFVSLAVRRKHPAAVLAVVGTVTGVIWVLDWLDGTTAVAGGIAVFSLGRWGTQPRSGRVFGSVATALLLLAAAQAVDEWTTEGWFRLGARAGVVFGPFWFGEALKARAALTASYRERAERAERERHEAIHLAALAERTRLARELHDVVAHSVSVMVVQANLADRLALIDPARSKEAIGHVASVGRSALIEMRHILAVLNDHDEPPTRQPLPGLGQLDELIELFQAAGLSVNSTISAPLPPMDVGRELCAYRVVQEALTNTLRHAPDATAHVTLRTADQGSLMVEVINGAGSGGSSVTQGAGRGLIGMRGRVAALGGDLSTGPTAGGGFAVLARIPIDEEVEL